MVKIFIIESPNPNDLLESRNEQSSLENMCRMFGHQTAAFSAYSKEDVEKIVKYVSRIKLEVSDTLCLHFSCHGNTDGIAIGPDFIKWFDFIKVLLPIFKNSSIARQTFIILSACGAHEQTITQTINKAKLETRKKIAPPYYFFVFNQEIVPWNDALMSWAILYHQLSKLVIYDKESVKEILNRIRKAEIGEIKYFRWDETQFKYLQFVGKISDSE